MANQMLRYGEIDADEAGRRCRWSLDCRLPQAGWLLAALRPPCCTWTDPKKGEQGAGSSEPGPPPLDVLLPATNHFSPFADLLAVSSSFGQDREAQSPGHRCHPTQNNRRVLGAAAGQARTDFRLGAASLTKEPCKPSVACTEPNTREVR
ncbi:hypothetical protein CMUS01_08237 [Colletotrichum musicola]|uniref:Uncharacterized protein n=1 Tax=Colletotrichum musicola TaxID=2175873 RepID=A0A8H6NDF2_9PEZI|nr:hypothetical protein CMUS01_08237 [Colletotrichum musicola]